MNNKASFSQAADKFFLNNEGLYNYTTLTDDETMLSKLLEFKWINHSFLRYHVLQSLRVDGGWFCPQQPLQTKVLPRSFQHFSQPQSIRLNHSLAWRMQLKVSSVK